MGQIKISETEQKYRSRQEGKHFSITNSLGWLMLMLKRFFSAQSNKIRLTVHYDNQHYTGINEVSRSTAIRKVAAPALRL